MKQAELRDLGVVSEQRLSLTVSLFASDTQE